MAMNYRMIPVTDDRGRLLLVEDDAAEPLSGSIVLTEGSHGTAWQRHFADGLWHSSRGGAPKGWPDLLQKRNVVLVYDADERPVSIRKRIGEAS